MFEKPLGMRDTFPITYKKIKMIKEEMEKEWTLWGYSFLETPALEYYNTVGMASAIQEEQLFKLLDQEGNTLVLRPDMTAPIARVAASKLLSTRNPLRLAYHSKVYRAQQREGGKAAEFEQLGIECIGDGTISADAEVIALMISSLNGLQLDSFIVSIGHIGFVQSLLNEVLGNDSQVHELQRFLFDKNYVGFETYVQSLSLSSLDKHRLSKLLSLTGKNDCLQIAYDLVCSEEARNALDELSLLWEQLDEYGVATSIKIDLGQVSHMSYYTGLVFEVSANSVGFPIGNGGRYDHLLTKFGKTVAATGFAISMNYLLQALEGTIQPVNECELVLFQEGWRKEALQFVREKRAIGVNVVMQDMNGVEDVGKFITSYQQVYFLNGEGSNRC